MKAFRLNGKAYETAPTPRLILRAKKILDTLADGDLLTSVELAAKAGYNSAGGAFMRAKANGLLGEYRLIVRYPSRQIVWGNKRTIAELSKHKEILE